MIQDILDYHIIILGFFFVSYLGFSLATDETGSENTSAIQEAWFLIQLNRRKKK